MVSQPFLAVTYSKSIVFGFLQARTTIVTQLNNLLGLTNLSRYEDIIKVMLITDATCTSRTSHTSTKTTTSYSALTLCSHECTTGWILPSL